MPRHPEAKLSMTSQRFVHGIMVVAAVSIANHAAANDSTAELATGGLVFTKSEAIEMRSEDLYISMKEIRVQYRFYNHANRDIVSQVAFPMPDISYVETDGNSIPTNDPEKILRFRTSVNGRPVATQVERKAVLDGTDVTDVLRSAGVSLVPKEKDDLSPAAREKLLGDGLIEVDHGSFRPRWKLKTTYYWKQTFPAHRELRIDHRYNPSVGSVVPMSASHYREMPGNLGIDQPHGPNRFCIDEAIWKAMERKPGTHWGQQIVHYVLKTGANWKGPIAKFRLVVDTGSPGNLVSLCAKGLRRINATQFELVTSNFLPVSDLAVLILDPWIPPPGYN
jgi:uncharacterized protein DUF4424